MLALAPLLDPVVGHTTSGRVLGWSGALLLAHQGGWDEILMVLVPVSLFAGLLYVANQRASRLADNDAATSSAIAEDVPPSGDVPSTDTPAAAAPAAPEPTPPRRAPKNERRGPV